MEVQSKVEHIIRQQLGLPEGQKLEATTELVNDLSADSLDSVEMVIELENEFHIEIADEEAERANTVGRVVSLVESKLGN